MASYEVLAPCLLAERLGQAQRPLLIDRPYPVGYPSMPHAEFLVREDIDVDGAIQPFALGQAEEWPLHRLALVAQRQIRNEGDEQVKLGPMIRLALIWRPCPALSRPSRI
jgi:hypothetical protein